MLFAKTPNFVPFEYTLAYHALLPASARLMMIDNDLNIVLANQSVVDFLRTVEGDLKRDLPNFSADRLIGTNIDGFHKNPAHQRRMLGELKEPYSTSIRLGGHIFNLRVCPVYDGQGQRIGSVMEWFDSKAADNEGQISAIHRVMAVIEFNLNGEILAANQNFLAAVEYGFEEIKGRHHRMFMPPEEANSPAYAEFWRSLGKGEYQQSRYRRVKKSGRDLWIEASYNPILDQRGQPYKVVKYATDITSRVEASRNVSRSMTDIARELDAVSAQTASVASASTQTSANVNAVASGAEELRTSVEEIARSMAKAETEQNSAADKVAAAMAVTQNLAAAARDMSGIVQLIGDIAGKVNLLALNATIEAARAGEAGKGFAVVAHEVKSLAGQTAAATQRISDEICRVQVNVDETVGNLAEINKAITTSREFVAGVSGAVEEQGAVSSDMSANMQSAAEAVADVDRSLEKIVEAVRTIKSAVDATNSLAANM